MDFFNIDIFCLTLKEYFFNNNSIREQNSIDRVLSLFFLFVCNLNTVVYLIGLPLSKKNLKILDNGSTVMLPIKNLTNWPTPGPVKKMEH